MIKKVNILVIDDEAVICLGCKKTLEPDGMTVDCTENGLTGLAKLQEKSYDIVLIDLMMPTLSGMDVLSSIKKMNKNIIPIVMTGYTTIESSIKALKNGAFDYLPKPFTCEELRDVISKAIDKMKKKHSSESQEFIS